MSSSTTQRITIARDVCIGSGNCLFYAPATFDLDDDDRVAIVDPHGDDAARVKAAVENCPSGALSLVDEQMG